MSQVLKLIFLVGVAVALPAMAADVSYRADVAPMMKKYCYECHSAEAQAPTMAEFKLDEEKYKKAKVGPRLDTYEHLGTRCLSFHRGEHAPVGQRNQSICGRQAGQYVQVPG